MGIKFLRNMEKIKNIKLKNEISYDILKNLKYEYVKTKSRIEDFVSDLLLYKFESIKKKDNILNILYNKNDIIYELDIDAIGIIKAETKIEKNDIVNYQNENIKDFEINYKFLKPNETYYIYSNKSIGISFLIPINKNENIIFAKSEKVYKNFLDLFKHEFVYIRNPITNDKKIEIRLKFEKIFDEVFYLEDKNNINSKDLEFLSQTEMIISSILGIEKNIDTSEKNFNTLIMSKRLTEEQKNAYKELYESNPIKAIEKIKEFYNELYKN
jgi:hypothetical protein